MAVGRKRGRERKREERVVSGGGQKEREKRKGSDRSREGRRD